MGSNCCKGDASRPIRSTSSIYSRSRAGASLDERFTTSDDAGGVRLTVSAAQTGDSGVYTLQASNAAGSDTSKIRLEVSAEETPTGEDPPSFLRRLQDLTVKVGSRTRFLVEIISSTECKVTWYRNERRLLEAERVALARDGNFWCADVAAVSVDDAGRWTCTAENAGGRASCSAHLNVLVPKAYKRPEFVEELRALLTEQGTVSLECKVVGVPTPVLRWFKDSREIKAGDVFALTANAEDPTSLGTYTCEAVNCMGRAYSSSKVHVVGRASREGSAKPSSGGMTPEPPPIFTKELEDAHVKICEHLTLGCHLVVPPWPRSVVWYNKEGKVEPGERYHTLEDGVGGYLLEIPSAEWADEGEWKCVATSAGGRVGITTCYVAMDVPKNYRKPRFMENLQAVLTEEGLVSFECKVVGFPTPVLSWFKDGQELKPGDVYQLTGTNSLGSYCCIARNCMGQASSSAELTVEDIQNQLNEEEKLQLFSKNQAPKFLQGLKSVEAKIDEPFRFTVKVAIPPEPSLLWYRDDQPVDESTRCHLEKEDKGIFNLDIQNLELLDQAEWKCVAMNDFGHSVTSCFLKLIIPRHYKKPRFLENLQAILSDEGAVNLECKVIGVPQPVLKWYKDGEELKPGDIHRIISGQDGTCCLGTYTCEAQNCMGIAASSASLLGFDDSMKTKTKAKEEQPLQRNLSLSTIHEERTSQMYDTPVGDITLDDKGEISFSFDGKEVSVSLYETPDLTEEEALQIVEMYADQLSENVTEHNVVELPPLRFVKETSTSGNLLMEAIIIDVSPDYFATPEEDLRTEADVEDLSIADENGLPQLSLDKDIEIGGEHYLEKTMALMSDERSDFAAKSSRRKSDSQRSADDFFSLSRDQSLSEEKRDDDTHVSESELQSFASARSSAKVKSKSSKISGEEGQESSELTKTIFTKDEIESKNEQLKPQAQELDIPEIKHKRERRTSRGSRRSSTSSEKSREELLRLKSDLEQNSAKSSLSDKEFNTTMSNISTSLTKVVNDIQLIERDIILKSELMSSAATASRSLEIISSLVTPLSEILSIAEAAKESVSESREVTSTIFNSMPQPLKTLQQTLTIIEKCIDMESDNKTLVKKTCVAFIETCGVEVQQVLKDISSVTAKNYIKAEEKILNEIESVASDMTTVIKFSAETIHSRNIISEASEIKPEIPTIEIKHLKDTQRAIFELKGPLNSLLRIVESAQSGNITDLYKVKQSEVIMNDMSASIQDLQYALEQIETLSVKETSSTLHKYNTGIIETVMDSVIKLRCSFEQLSTEPNTEEDKTVLNETLSSLKENLIEISNKIETIDKSVGQFDILQSENKLDVLQKIAQILIALENNISRLEAMPTIKTHMDAFHKNLTKVLEKVIESNDAVKYQALLEICDTVNIINASIRNLDSENVLPLASLSNTLKIIQANLVSNVIESELNCSIMNNISDVLVGIQEAINKAEDSSLQIDSEYIQDLSSKILNEEKVNIILEHIDHTIAAVNTVKTIDSTEELKLTLTPALENVGPILEELRKCVASVQSNTAEQDEHISELSNTSFVQTIATPLCELNQSIVVLNQLIAENIDYVKENTEIITAIAEPLHELHTTLEILQQDVISQYGEDLTPYEVSVNIASVVQNLQSCIVMIQEQAGLEGAEDMSTLEDISGIKTSADTIPSDRLVLPIAEETAIEQSYLPLNQEEAITATAQTLQSLNEHIMVLQTPDVIEALDTLSEISDYASLKSVIVDLGDLHTGIEGILHPVLIEGSVDLDDTANITKLAAIAEPMHDIQQSLSVLDTSNIPVLENILDLPSEKINFVFQGISELKNSLEQCMCAVLPAMEIANNTIEISNKVSTLREVCEQLKDIFETSKNAPNQIALPKEVQGLETVVNDLINATDVSKDIKIDQVKSITEELYLKVKDVQEDIIQFTALSPEQLSQEAKLIQIVNEVETNIAVLEQYDFIDLSRASDLTTCMSPQLAAEIDSESLAHIYDIAEDAVNILQDSYQGIPIADLTIVEDFFKTCKNEFSLLRCLVTKSSSHKQIIRLLQEFNSLQTLINNFTTKRLELRLSDDVNECLTNFLINADECLRNARNSLIKVVDTQSVMLIKNPISQLECTKELRDTMEDKASSEIVTVIETLIQAAEISKHLENSLACGIIEELSKPNQTRDPNQEEIMLAEKNEELANMVRVNKDSISIDSSSLKVFEELSKCIDKHNHKDALGTGKTLIVLKCLAECATIVQEKNTMENTTLQEIAETKAQESTLKEVLAEMLQPLQALQTELVNIREQVLSGTEEDSIFIDINTTETIMHTMTELHKDIMQQIETDHPALQTEDIPLLQEVDKELHNINDSIRTMENVQAIQAMKEITKPMEDIEKSLQAVLTAEKDILEKEALSKEVSAELIDHIDQYLETFEIIEEVTAVIKLEDITETLDIARKLKKSISLNEESENQITLNNAREEQIILAQQLKSAISALQVQVLDSAPELAPLINSDALEKITQVTTQLEANLVAVASLQTPVGAAESSSMSLKASETANEPPFSTTTELVKIDIVEIEKPREAITKIKETVEALPEAKQGEKLEQLEQQSTILSKEQVDTQTEPNKTLNDEAVSTTGASKNIKDSLSLEILETSSTETAQGTIFAQTDDSQNEKAMVEQTSGKDNLLQHITEYVSEDMIEVVDTLSSVVDVKDLKKFMDIAIELLECIATTEIHTEEEIMEQIQTPQEQQLILVKNLKTALSTLNEQTLESLQNFIPPDSKANVEKIIFLIQTLKTDSESAKISQPDVLQCSKLNQQKDDIDKETVSQAQFSTEDIEVAFASHDNIERESESTEVKHLEPISQESLTKENIEITDSLLPESEKLCPETLVKDMSRSVKNSQAEFIDESTGKLLIPEGIQISETAQSVEIISSKVTDIKDEVIITEVLEHEQQQPEIAGSELLVVTEKNIIEESPQLELQTTEAVTIVAEDTLTQHINLFLSDNILHTVSKQPINAAEFHQAVQIATELKELLITPQLKQDKLVLSVGKQSYQQELIQLQQVLSRIHIQLLEHVSEKSPNFDDVQSAANVISNFANDLLLTITTEAKNKVTDINPAKDIYNEIKITNDNSVASNLGEPTNELEHHGTIEASEEFLDCFNDNSDIWTQKNINEVSLSENKETTQPFEEFFDSPTLADELHSAKLSLPATEVQEVTILECTENVESCVKNINLAEIQRTDSLATAILNERNIIESELAVHSNLEAPLDNNLANQELVVIENEEVEKTEPVLNIPSEYESNESKPLNLEYLEIQSIELQVAKETNNEPLEKLQTSGDKVTSSNDLISINVIDNIDKETVDATPKVIRSASQQHEPSSAVTDDGIIGTNDSLAKAISNETNIDPDMPVLHSGLDAPLENNSSNLELVDEGNEGVIEKTELKLKIPGENEFNESKPLNLECLEIQSIESQIAIEKNNEHLEKLHTSDDKVNKSNDLMSINGIENVDKETAESTPKVLRSASEQVKSSSAVTDDGIIGTNDRVDSLATAITSETNIIDSEMAELHSGLEATSTDLTLINVIDNVDKETAEFTPKVIRLKSQQVELSSADDAIIDTNDDKNVVLKDLLQASDCIQSSFTTDSITMSDNKVQIKDENVCDIKIAKCYVVENEFVSLHGERPIETINDLVSSADVVVINLEEPIIDKVKVEETTFNEASQESLAQNDNRKNFAEFTNNDSDETKLQETNIIKEDIDHTESVNVEGDDGLDSTTAKVVENEVSTDKILLANNSFKALVQIANEQSLNDSTCDVISDEINNSVDADKLNGNQDTESEHKIKESVRDAKVSFEAENLCYETSSNINMEVPSFQEIPVLNVNEDSVLANAICSIDSMSEFASPQIVRKSLPFEAGPLYTCIENYMTSEDITKLSKKLASTPTGEYINQSLESSKQLYEIIRMPQSLLERQKPVMELQNALCNILEKLSSDDSSKSGLLCKETQENIVGITTSLLEEINKVVSTSNDVIQHVIEEANELFYNIFDNETDNLETDELSSPNMHIQSTETIDNLQTIAQDKVDAMNDNKTTTSENLPLDVIDTIRKDEDTNQAFCQNEKNYEILNVQDTIAVDGSPEEEDKILKETTNDFEKSSHFNQELNDEANIARNFEERSNLIGHIEAFITEEVAEIVNEISMLTNVEAVKESIPLAKKLRESVVSIDYRAIVEEASPLNDKNVTEQAVLAQTLQDALSILQTQALDHAEVLAPLVTPETLQKVSVIISHLQDDLGTAIVAVAQSKQLGVTSDVVNIDEDKSIIQLESLLQDVNMNINQADITIDSECIRDSLDEIQTVIIKLKSEYDGVTNDILNETLEDLECSVRSVQLQINEQSPPELLNEACATLQLLFQNMDAAKQAQDFQINKKVESTEIILDKCSKETEESVNLLDLASKLDMDACTSLKSIVENLQTMRDSLKTLRESFLVDADTVIENGVKILECLNQVEENIFTLEKEVETAENIKTDTRDSIIAAVHSVYGSISNMRGTVSSVQKRFMFENFGKPSESLLHSLKIISSLASTDEESNKPSWKKLSKSLRKVLNHFEDIKFYINLDKTARLPSDAAFTKIILEELKDNISSVLVPRAMILDSTVLEKVNITIRSVEANLQNIESEPTLQVKNKIPMFKNISSGMLSTITMINKQLNVTKDKTEKVDLVSKVDLISEFSDVNQELQDQEPSVVEEDYLDTVKEATTETNSSSQGDEDLKLIDDSKYVQTTSENIESSEQELSTSSLPMNVETENSVCGLEKATDVISLAETGSFIQDQHQTDQTQKNNNSANDVQDEEINAQKCDLYEKSSDLQIKVKTESREGSSSAISTLKCDTKQIVESSENQVSEEKLHEMGDENQSNISKIITKAEEIGAQESNSKQLEDNVHEPDNELRQRFDAKDRDDVLMQDEENESSAINNEDVLEEQEVKDANDQHKTTDVERTYQESYDSEKFELISNSKQDDELIPKEEQTQSTDGAQTHAGEKAEQKLRQDVELKINEDNSFNQLEITKAEIVKQNAELILKEEEACIQIKQSSAETVKQEKSLTEETGEQEVKTKLKEDNSNDNKESDIKQQTENTRVFEADAENSRSFFEEEVEISARKEAEKAKTQQQELCQKEEEERIQKEKKDADLNQTEVETCAKNEGERIEGETQEQDSAVTTQQDVKLIQTEDESRVHKAKLEKNENTRAEKEKQEQVAVEKAKNDAMKPIESVHKKTFVAELTQKDEIHVENQQEKDEKDKDTSEQAKMDVELQQKEEDARIQKEKLDADLKQDKDKACAKEEIEKQEQEAKKDAKLKQEEEARFQKEKLDAELKQKEGEASINKEQDRAEKEKDSAEKSKQADELKLKEKDACCQKEKLGAVDLKQIEDDARVKQEQLERAEKEKDAAVNSVQAEELKLKQEEARKEKEKLDAELKQNEDDARVKKDKLEEAEKEKDAAEKSKQVEELKLQEEEARSQKEKLDAVDLKQIEDDARVKHEQLERAEKEKQENDAAEKAKKDAALKRKEEEAHIQKGKEKQQQEAAEKAKKDAELKQKEEAEARILKQKEKQQQETAEKAEKDTELKQKEEEARFKKEKEKQEQDAAEKAKKNAELKQKEENEARIQKEKETQEQEAAEKAKKDAELKQIEKEARAKKEKEKQEQEAAEKAKKDAELKQKEDKARIQKEKEKQEQEAAEKAKEDAKLKQKEEEEARFLKEKDKQQQEVSEKAKKDAELKHKVEEARIQKEKQQQEAAEKAKKDAEMKQREEEARTQEEKEKQQQEAAEKAKKDAELKQKEEEEARFLKEKEKQQQEAAEKAKKDAELKQKEEEEARILKQKEKQQQEAAEKAKKDAELKRKEEEARIQKEKEKQEQEAAEKTKKDAERKQKEDEARIQKEKEKQEQEAAEKTKKEADVKQKKERELAKKEKERQEQEAAEKAKKDAERKQKEEKARIQKEKEKQEQEAVENAKKEAELKQKEKEDLARKEKEMQEQEAAEKAKKDAERKQKEEKARIQTEKEKQEQEAVENAKKEAELKQKEKEDLARKEKEKQEQEAAEKTKKEVDVKQKKDRELAKKEKERQEQEAAEKAKKDAERKQKEEKARIQKEKEKQEQEAVENAKKEAELKQKEKEDLARKEKEMQEQEAAEKAKRDAERKQKKEEALIQKQKKEVVENSKKEAELKQKEEEGRIQKEKEKQEQEAAEKAKQNEEKARIQKEKDKQDQEVVKKARRDAERKQKEEEERIQKEKEKQEQDAAEKAKKDAELKQKEEEARIQKEKIDAELKQKEEEARVKEEQERAEKEKQEKDAFEKAKQDAEMKQKEEETRFQKEKAEKEKHKQDAAEKAKQEAEIIQKKEKDARLLKEKKEAELKGTEDKKRIKKDKARKSIKEADMKQKEEEDRILKERADDELKLKEAQTRAKKEKAEVEKSKQDQDAVEKTKQDKEKKLKEEARIKKRNSVSELKIDDSEGKSDNNEKVKKSKETRRKSKDVKGEVELNEEGINDISSRIHKEEQKSFYDGKEITMKTYIDDSTKKSTKYTERLSQNERRDDEVHIYNDDRQPKKENDDITSKRHLEENNEPHYIKEYQYEPSRTTQKLEAKEKPRFVDHNHRDYTMEFARPSGYRERSFDVDKSDSLTSHDYLGRNADIYKAQTLILDSQLRASTPLRLDAKSSRTSEPPERRPEIRPRSKALSEARSITSEKRTGVSRDSKRKPMFSTYLTDRTAVEGSRVKLTCSVLSSTDPTVTWYKNGILLDNKLKYRTKFIDGLITMEVLNAVPSDSAEYSCTIVNENGSISSSANLKVYPSFEASPIPPTFTRSIRETYHLAENELVLECRIRGQPLPTITWLKDEKSVSNNSRYQAYYLADGVCRLAIEHPTPEDSGKYTCKAENSVWSDQIAHVVNFTGKESRQGPNIATIEKSRFNRQVMESRRPHFTNVLSDYKVVSGGTIGFQVEIKGAPTRVEWLREGCSVTEVYRNAKTFVEQGLYTLALSDVTEKESGMYTCRAWSSQSHVDMNAAITVVQPNELDGKPAIIVGRPEKDILISIGEDVNISFRVQGEPKPKVVLMKGIRDITTSQRVCKMTSDDYVKFTLKRSVVSDAGTYCILARNAYGVDRAFVTVVVRQRASSDNLISDWTYPVDESSLSIAERTYKSVPERIPGVPCVVEGGNNWISLSWPKSDPGQSAPVLAYKVESWLLGKDGGARWSELGITPLNSFDAFNLKQGEEYHFRVTPRNRYGWGESVQTSAPVSVGLAGDRPEFTESLPGQLKVLVGETANLTCSVKGTPAPEVIWMKNGHEIEDEDRRFSSSYNGFNCNLTIKDINIEDEARYSCEATNLHGRASTYARLAVVTDRSIWEADAKLKRERSADVDGDYPPQFTMRLRDRRVQATYPVRLTCQVIGSPDPRITWFKDGFEIKPDNRRSHFQDEHFHTLEIAPTNLEDGGVYEAMARNSSGAVSCRCNLVVDKGIRAYVAPEFCCGLEPLYRLTDGEELRISAVVEAYPSVGVTWYRDGVRLRPSRRAIMTLDRDGQIELALAAVTSRDAGVYSCTASNEVGRASTSGKVEVIGSNVARTPPVFISHDEPYSKEPMFIRKPRSSEAREGDTVIIACEVVGDPKPDVYWLRDFLKPDYYRDSSHFKRMGDGPEYRFEIPHAKLDYTGAYSVVARNIHGEAKAIISLQILAKDPTSGDDAHNIRYGRVEVLPRFTKELTDLLSCDGDAVEFECHLTGNPEPSVRWFHYQELIRDSPDFETSFDEGAARLKIKQVTAEDEGTYTCEATNNIGKVKSSACLVVYPPGEPNTLSQRLRRPPTFLSAASTPRSTPRSTPARSVSRTPGPETRRLCSPARTLAPSFYTYPFNKVAEEGDTVTLQCAIKGNPAPWATWDKDGVIITPSSRITIKEKDDVLRVLEIEQVTVDDVGAYRITIENEFGRQEASARIEVITQKGKFYAGVRAVSPSPRKTLTYRNRRPSTPRQD